MPPVLARKVSRAKWSPGEGLGPDEIQADAIAVDLKTSGNTLSFWRCKSGSSDDVKRVVLAIIVGNDKAERLDFVCLDEQAVITEGLATRNTEGITCVVSLRNHHVDLEKLDLTRLGKVARLVASAYRAGPGEAFLTLTSAEVISLVAGAVEDGLVSLDDLKEKMKTAVERKLQGSR